MENNNSNSNSNQKTSGTKSDGKVLGSVDGASRMKPIVGGQQTDSTTKKK